MKPAPLITVLLAEDHAIVRQGLCALLTVDGHFKTLGEARTGREAVEMARALEGFQAANSRPSENMAARQVWTSVPTSVQNATGPARNSLPRWTSV